MAAVAYVDPGNFAATLSAGGRFGDRLAWVVLSMSLMAMPVHHQHRPYAPVVLNRLGELTDQAM